jgi:hypothetical protein
MGDCAMKERYERKRRINYLKEQEGWECVRRWLIFFLDFLLSKTRLAADLLGEYIIMCDQLWLRSGGYNNVVALRSRQIKERTTNSLVYLKSNVLAWWHQRKAAVPSHLHAIIHFVVDTTRRRKLVVHQEWQRSKKTYKDKWQNEVQHKLVLGDT